jgi:hypothetical protein
MTDAESVTGTGHHPTAKSNADAQAQPRSRQHKMKSKGKQPHGQSTTAQPSTCEPDANADNSTMTSHQANATANADPMTSHPPDTNAQSPDHNTERQSYVQVNQATMKMVLVMVNQSISFLITFT